MRLARADFVRLVFVRALLACGYLPRAVLLTRARDVFALAFGDLARFVIGTRTLQRIRRP
jgi:hypothetical protein